MHMRDRQQTFDRGTQLVQSLTGIGGDDERIWLQRGESFTSRLVRLIGLVEYENTRNRGRAFDVRQHVIDRVDLRERVRWEPSTTCRITSASATSSRVDLNASTSWVGRRRTKPTVST